MNAGEVSVGGVRLHTRFAVPSGPANEVLAALDAAGLGVARARVAAVLSDPDPFHIRAALHAGGAVVGCPGAALSADAADAALLAADHTGESRVAGLFAGRPMGPTARSISVDDSRRTWLRWPPGGGRAPARRVTLGKVESWTAAQIGDAAVATIRCAEPLPGGGVALGSDYGLTLWRKGRFEAFPWPRGSRREARRVEAMAVHGGRLHVATSQSLYTWDFVKEVHSRRHGPDEEGGFDDLCSLHASEERLYAGYRTRFEGGAGPRDCIALCADPTGVVWAGTRSGELHVVDGGGPVRVFADHKPRPIRHLAFADGALWVAARGALHRFNGASWSETSPEPTALAVDPDGRLWALAEGRLFVLEGGALRPLDVPLERPWCVAAEAGAVWVGGRERVWRIGHA